MKNEAKTARTTRKGLLVHVLRAAGRDCTNNGVSTRFTHFVLTGPGIPELFEPGPEIPELVLVQRRIGGQEYLHAEPVDRPANMAGPMAGGNYITASDSRFPNTYPIAVHDRFDTWADHDRLTR
jgi:hypothetical protein